MGELYYWVPLSVIFVQTLMWSQSFHLAVSKRAKRLSLLTFHLTYPQACDEEQQYVTVNAQMTPESLQYTKRSTTKWLQLLLTEEPQRA